MNRKISNELRQQLIEFFNSHRGIVAVYIFGSYGTEYEHPRSDIDLGVVFNYPIILTDELAFDAELSLNVPADREIDFVNLNCAGVPLQFRAISEGELIFEGDYIRHSEFIERVLKSYYEYFMRNYLPHFYSSEGAERIG